MDIWTTTVRRARFSTKRCRSNPEDSGAWLIPAYATTIRPPTVPEGCVAIFNGGLAAVGEWRIELAANQAS